MSDDDLDEFYINEENCRSGLFQAMKADYDRFGPVSKQRGLEAIGLILSSGQFEQFWTTWSQSQYLWTMSKISLLTSAFCARACRVRCRRCTTSALMCR